MATKLQKPLDILSILAEMDDPRIERTKKHRLLDILFIGLVATMGRKGDILLFCCLPWSAAGAKGGFQAELLRRQLSPGGVSEWGTSLNA